MLAKGMLPRTREDGAWGGADRVTPNRGWFGEVNRAVIVRCPLWMSADRSDRTYA